ncbi:MAG: DUF5320 domain-containing protein [Candidatus Marinimicrobia bacterium]|nr:DUF5320 domain-containing protein [Candidatus Neomarinimicrobiota bacterium]
MPRGDRTGPDGYGPMTGRGLGYCNGYDSPGFTKGVPRGGAGYGRGMGYGRGGGFGFGRGSGWRANPAPYPGPAYAPQAPNDRSGELRALKDRAQQMKEDLEAVNARISELEK